MIDETAQALSDFTRRYCDAWQHERAHPPASSELFGVPSPCIESTTTDEIYWLPQPFTLAKNLDAVERALDIRLQPSVVAWYTTQFAGDMHAELAGERVTLLQTWSEEDFVRVQENLIGHLLMKRRLKHSPTLFIGTLTSELDVVSVCNLSGEVIKETLGTNRRSVLAATIDVFLRELTPSAGDVRF
ncbi:SecY-interacting protein [Erwinia oleae]|uniref:SecY-interacting protein n=1 Tax=Erwinia oleae TaxID=796334 RepID=UPI000558D369|nr:SecY-interacting protein [Erwinia oleae]